MNKSKIKKVKAKIVASLMVMAFAMNIVGIKTQAKDAVVKETIATDEMMNESMVYNFGIQPYTTMSNCEIVMAFTTNGLEMNFSTSSYKISSVIGVKDIKVQQKMWYGWKTVFTSDGAENYDECVFMGEVTYPDAVVGKTYRVTCVHYANYDVYEEVENDTGAFKFIL